MAKARHYRKTNRRWLPLLLVLVVLAAVGVFVGAVLVKENTSYEGNILPDDVILSERQWLFPQENGGFLLLSTEEGISSEEQQNFTKGLYLTQDCNVSDSDSNYMEYPGTVRRAIYRNGAVHVLTSSLTMAEDTLTEIAYLQVFPLDGSQFTSLPPPILFNNSEAALDLKTLSIDGDGTYYCLSGDHTSVLFYSQAESAWVKTELPSEVTEITGLHMQGQDGYLKFVNVDGAEALMRCTLTQSVAEDTEEIQKTFVKEAILDTTCQFPIDFIGGTFWMDQQGGIYQVTEQAWILFSAEESGFIEGGILSNGEMAIHTSNYEIGRFFLSNLTAPTHTYSYNGTICAMGVNGDVGAILHDGTHYRGVLLDDKAFGIGTEEPEPEASSSPEENSSSDTSAEAPSSSVESELPVSSTPVNSGVSSGSELEHPIQSGLDSSTVSSNVESNASSNTSSEEKEMLRQIISSKYSIDRGANLVVLPEGVTLAQFRKTVPLDGATLTAEQYNGGILSGGKLGTGMRLRLYNDWELVDEVVVVVKGDLNGNGVINSADEQLLFRHLAEETPLTEYFYTAADLNEDGSVNTLDLLLWKQHQY